MKLLVIILMVGVVFVKVCMGYVTSDWPLRTVSSDQVDNLADEIKSWLNKNEYKIPQLYYSDAKIGNVVTGQFNEDSLKDTAVLVTRNDSSEIIIFWSGSVKKIENIEKSQNSGWFQVVDYDENDKRIWGFSRYLAKADSRYILEKNPHIEKEHNIDAKKLHDGLIDGFAEKGSAILYKHKNQWVDLYGAD